MPLPDKVEQAAVRQMEQAGQQKNIPDGSVPSGMLGILICFWKHREFYVSHLDLFIELLEV